MADVIGGTILCAVALLWLLVGYLIGAQRDREDRAAIALAIALARALDADLEGDGRIGPATREHLARTRAADELGGAA